MVIVLFSSVECTRIPHCIHCVCLNCVAAKLIRMALNDRTTLTREFTRNSCRSTWVCWLDVLGAGLATCVEENVSQSQQNVRSPSFYWEYEIYNDNDNDRV